jgi:hypothetical protein
VNANYHAVARELAPIPTRERDRLTSWLWHNVGPFEEWTIEGLEAAKAAVALPAGQLSIYDLLPVAVA